MPQRKAFSAGWLCPALLCLLLLPGRAAGDGAVPGWNKLVYVMYRVEVTNYCGLTSDEVIAGFRLQRDAVLDAYPLTKSRIDSARSEAGKLVHWEWGNRGLGGFRQWCRNDATRYADQFVRALDTMQNGAQNEKQN